MSDDFYYLVALHCKRMKERQYRNIYNNQSHYIKILMKRKRKQLSNDLLNSNKSLSEINKNSIVIKFQ